MPGCPGHPLGNRGRPARDTNAPSIARSAEHTMPCCAAFLVRIITRCAISCNALARHCSNASKHHDQTHLQISFRPVRISALNHLAHGRVNRSLRRGPCRLPRLVTGGVAPRHAIRTCRNSLLSRHRTGSQQYGFHRRTRSLRCRALRPRCRLRARTGRRCFRDRTP